MVQTAYIHVTNITKQAINRPTPLNNPIAIENRLQKAPLSVYVEITSQQAPNLVK